MPIELIIPPSIDDGAPGGVDQLAREAQALSKAPQLQVLVTADAEGTTAANTRRFALQVANRRRRPALGLFTLLVVIGTAEAGGPAGTQTVALVTGAVVQTISANQAYLLYTDASGKAVIDVTIAGAGTRYVRADVLGAKDVSAGFTWT